MNTKGLHSGRTLKMLRKKLTDKTKMQWMWKQSSMQMNNIHFRITVTIQ